MRSYTSLLIAICLSSLSIYSTAQPINSLAFDGLDDYASTPSASSLVSGGNVSMTCWAYLENASPSYPNFDGIIGFRNESDADFYILQLSATSFEARLRNSSGIAYSINAQGVQINTWTHLALTYDGANLVFYVNGVQSGITSASGYLGNSSSPFFMGRLDYQITQFLLQGKLDEVSLWSKALSSSEVQCIYESGIDPMSSDLEFYYEMNQGVAGGNNSGISTLTSSTGNNPASLNNFSLSGNTSNFVDGIMDFDLISATLCGNDSYTFAGMVLDSTGTYYDSLVASSGCDSIIRLDLEVIEIDTSVTVNSNVMIANEANASWQWVDCNNNFTPIPNATNQSFGVPGTGSYAVIVTRGSCSDTSRCFDFVFTNSSFWEEGDPAEWVQVFDKNIVINLPGTISARASILDLTGRVMKEQAIHPSGLCKIDTDYLKPGIYILCLQSEHGRLKSMKFLAR